MQDPTQILEIGIDDITTTYQATIGDSNSCVTYGNGLVIKNF